VELEKRKTFWSFFLAQSGKEKMEINKKEKDKKK
jgi:hypothetical protein